MHGKRTSDVMMMVMAMEMMVEMMQRIKMMTVLIGLQQAYHCAIYTACLWPSSNLIFTSIKSGLPLLYLLRN